MLKRAEQNALLCFAEIHRRKLYRELGYSSIHMYAIEALGFSKARASQFLRLSESLDELPVLRRSIVSGELSWTKAREVASVATPRSEKRWVEKAMRSSSRALETEVRRVREQSRAARGTDARQGSLLDSAGNSVAARRSASGSAEDSATGSTGTTPAAAAEPKSASLEAIEVEIMQVLSLRFRPEELARFEALMKKIRKTGRLRGESREVLVLTGLEALLDLEGREPAAATSDKPGERESKPADAVADEATGEAGSRGREAEFPRGNSASPYQVILYRCETCATTRVATSRGLKALSARAAEHLTCDARVMNAAGKSRATIPPGLRRRILARDGHRCRAKGCGGASFLEVHHVVPREAGGKNTAENLITLCSRCHRLVHERALGRDAIEMMIHCRKAPRADDTRSGGT